MTESPGAQSPIRQEQEAVLATLFTALCAAYSRDYLLSYCTILGDIARHTLFMLRTNEVVRIVENNRYTRDSDTELTVHNAIGNAFIDILWTEQAGLVATGADYPLRLTPLGLDAYAYLGKFLRTR